MFFYQAKLLSFTPIWNMWVSRWTGNSEEHKKQGLVDLNILNQSLYHEFVFETLPQITIQFVNAGLMRQLTTLGYISISFSIFFAFNGLYTFAYSYIIRTIIMCLLS